jgi:branched-chain amino acid transport system ATP-binding protein
MPVLSVKDVDVSYGDLQALRGITFAVMAGEVISIVGSNGSGKSTTLRTISGILRAKRGSIRFLDNEISRTAPSKIVEMGVSHVPEGRQLFPNMTVLENVEMGAQFPHTRKNKADTIEMIFDFFPRLKERLNQKAGTLSGGEQQMLAIGRGLMSQPKLMMLDEPSLGLSPLLVSTIFEIIRKINEQGTAILLIEQNVYHALSMSTRGYVLENGEIALQDTGEALLNNPHIKKTYLGL